MSAKAIDELSLSIQKAVAEIKRLRRENALLEEKAGKLEKRLGEAPPVADDGADRRQRERLRGRVVALVEHLEGALDDTG